MNKEIRHNLTGPVASIRTPFLYIDCLFATPSLQDLPNL